MDGSICGSIRMSTVQELPPVWNHQIVTKDSVHVNDNGLYLERKKMIIKFIHQRITCRMSVHDRTDRKRMELDHFGGFTPLATDPEDNNLPASNCCLLVRCHQILFHSLYSVVRQAFNKQHAPTFVRTCNSSRPNGRVRPESFRFACRGRVRFRRSTLSTGFVF